MNQKTNKPLRVLGIDPGYDRLGIAILEGDRSHQTVLHSECFETVRTDDFPDRLHEALSHVQEVIKKHEPQEVALETLFFSKNQKTAMRVAEMRGGLLFVARDLGCSVTEYAPQQIKSAVSGNGRGTKHDVAAMVHRLLSLPQKKMLDDEYDAIAVALTHLVSSKS